MTAVPERGLRVAIDILGASEYSGGMREHSTQIIRAWSAAFPDDVLHVIGPEWARRDLVLDNVTVYCVPRGVPLLRAVGQFVTSAVIARRHGAAVLISLNQVVSPFSGRPTICFQHDWRHLKHPDEFGTFQRLRRRLWVYSARWADVNACVSAKTRRETLAVAPSARTVIIPNGYDHAARWRTAPGERRKHQVVTFGHHTNKRPELMIKAFGLLRDRLPADARLVVLGARGDYARELGELCRQLSVAHVVELPGFVSDERYRELVSQSGLVALVSSDEGFGLPVAEAMWLGVPALITDDSGMTEVFGDYPEVVAPDPAAIAAVLPRLWASGDRPRPSTRASLPTWQDAARCLRAEAVRLAKPRGAGPADRAETAGSSAG